MPDELATLQRLNADYNSKFGWPFILAVRGPRGVGLTRAEIIATFERRLQGHPDFELTECLRNVHRIAEIRLNDKFGVTPDLGNQVWDWAETLARYSDPGYAEAGQLTVIAAAFLLVGLPFRQRSWYRSRVVVPASCLIAAVGLFWSVQRAFF